MNLQGKVAWITGASSGIGEALAKESSKAGARLILSARRVEELERVRAACTNSDQHTLLPFDLADFDAATVVEKATDAAGQLDLLIHSGGIAQRGAAIDTSIDVDRRIMEVNYFGTVALTKALLPHMVARKSGQIVVISSVSGKISTPQRSAYSASKHALHGFFESLRAEVADDNIHILLSCPGYVNTDISYHALTSDGTPYGKPEPLQVNGMTPEAVALRTLRAIERKEAEFLCGGSEAFAVQIYRFLPGFYRRVMRRRNSAS